MKKNIIHLAAFAFLMLLISSCKKEASESGIKAVFSYVADGYKVNFTNFSNDATEFLWDFNDGSGATSTSRSPQHIFKSKGDFIVSLTAKKGEVTSLFKDTVTILGPNIKVDADFSDWEYVDYTFVNEPGKGGNILGVKTFANSTDLFFLLEGTSAMSLSIIQVYLNTDNNAATGYSSWQYPGGSGSEYMLEGSPSDKWGQLSSHSGPPSDFGGFTSIASFEEAISLSEIKTAQGKKLVEFSIKRANLANLGTSLKFAFIELTSGWSQAGSMPFNQEPTATFATFPL